MPEFRQESINQLKQLKPEDVKVFNSSAIPLVYTVIARPNKETTAIIVKIQKQLKSIDPHHYYYPSAQLHLTLIGNIASSLNKDILINSLRKNLTSPIQFILYGLASNKFCASISAYPLNYNLSNMREAIRKDIGDQGEDYQIHLSSYEKMGWINFMRYLKTPKQELLDELRRSSEEYVGLFKPENVEVSLTTSKVLDPRYSKLQTKINMQ